MSKVEEIMQELRLDEEKLQIIINHLQRNIVNHNNKMPYQMFLNFIRFHGYHIKPAEKIIGILYLRGIFTENIDYWPEEKERILKDF